MKKAAIALQECLNRELADFTADEISGHLKQERHVVETAIVELVESGLAGKGKSGQKGTVYVLTVTGKNYAKTL